jgi:hypothetical protein
LLLIQVSSTFHFYKTSTVYQTLFDSIVYVYDYKNNLIQILICIMKTSLI